MGKLKKKTLNQNWMKSFSTAIEKLERKTVFEELLDKKSLNIKRKTKEKNCVEWEISCLAKNLSNLTEIRKRKP